MKIWGVLNVTPDSFSDGGKYALTDLAADHAGKIYDSDGCREPTGGIHGRSPQDEEPG